MTKKKKDKTGVDAVLQKASYTNIKRIGKICEALLTGKINSRVVKYAEE